MYTGNVFKVKNSKLKQWKTWCHKINNELRSESIKSLVEESVKRELFILLKIKGDFYTIGMGEGDFLKPEDTPLNREHKRNLRECLEYIGPVEILYDLISDTDLTQKTSGCINKL